MPANGERAAERGAAADQSAEAPRFFYDLGSAASYLVAERINGLFIEATGAAPQWVPVLAADLPGESAGPPGESDRTELERQASAQGLAPIRWPDPWPRDLTFAMRIATFAAEIGRSVSLPLYAFRQAFAAGRDLSVPDNVMIAAAACELHPRALLAAAARPAIQLALAAATAESIRIGIAAVPSIAVGGVVASGPLAPEQILGRD